MNYLKCILVVMICLPLAGVSFGEDQQPVPVRDQAAIPAYLAPVYGAAGMEPTTEAIQPAMKLSLGSQPTTSPGTLVGITTYDMQHNCTMGRQIAHGNDQYLYFDWTYKDDNILGGARYVAVGQYDIAQCQLAPGAFASMSRTGYCGIDVYDGIWPVPAAHQSYSGTNPHAYWDDDYPVPPPGDGYIGEPVITSFIWPKIDMDDDGVETILHMVATLPAAAGDPNVFIYYRRVGPYGAGMGVWSSGTIVDTGMNSNITVASSPFSDKVALVWNAPADYRRDTPDEFASQYENDVWFAVTDDNGAFWESIPTGVSIGHTVDHGILGGYDNGTGGNLTTYAWDGDYKAYCDMSALWSTIDSPDDYLQIVWGCRQWSGISVIYRRNSAMFHWSQKTDVITTVAVADWDVGGACYAHAWGGDIAKMTISQCDGRLYIVYTQFGNADQPCTDVDSRNHVLNGEIYITMSSDGGLTWGTPYNLTNTPTPMCDSGFCDNDYWASAARYGRYDECDNPEGQYVLDILYINDKMAGACVVSESGFWTVNNVLWLATPCYGGGPIYNCGDVNDDGLVNVGDAVYLIAYIFNGGPPPQPTECIGDANNDGMVNVADVVYIINYVFKQGDPPGTECCT